MDEMLLMQVGHTVGNLHVVGQADVLRHSFAFRSAHYIQQRCLSVTVSHHTNPLHSLFFESHDVRQVVVLPDVRTFGMFAI